MDPTKNLDENLDDFNTLCTELVNSGEEMKGVDQAVILLNSLSDSYKEIKAALKYGRDKLSVDMVLDALRTKELELKSEKKENDALFVKGRQSQHQNSRGRSFRGRGKTSSLEGNILIMSNRETRSNLVETLVMLTLVTKVASLAIIVTKRVITNGSVHN